MNRRCLYVLVLSLVLSTGVFPTRSQAAISFISATQATGSSVTLSTHAAGDFILIMACDDSGTPPTEPGGWTTIDSTNNAATVACIASYKIAASASETSGTWTNAVRMVSAVFRGQHATPIGGKNKTTGTGTTVTFPAVTMTVTDGTSWVLGLCITTTSSPTTYCSTPPSGMTNHTVSSATAYKAGIDSTNAGVTSWSSTDVTMTTGSWITFTIEVQAVSSATPQRRSVVY